MKLGLLFTAVGLVATAQPALAVHYGCVTSPASPKVLFMYENEGLPLHYVEKMARKDGSDMLKHVPDVLGDQSGFLKVGYSKDQIEERKKRIVVLSAKDSKVELDIPYIDPDDFRLKEQLNVKLNKAAIFDGESTDKLIYTFCGDD